MCSEVYNKERSNLGFRALFAVCHATFTPGLKGGWPPSLITAGCTQLPVWARSSSAPRAPCESSRRRLTDLPLGQDSHFASPALSMFLVTTSYQCKHLKDLYYRCAAWAEMQQQYRLFWHNFPPTCFLLTRREGRMVWFVPLSVWFLPALRPPEVVFSVHLFLMAFWLLWLLVLLCIWTKLNSSLLGFPGLKKEIEEEKNQEFLWMVPFLKETLHRKCLPLISPALRGRGHNLRCMQDFSFPLVFSSSMPNLFSCRDITMLRLALSLFLLLNNRVTEESLWSFWGKAYTWVNGRCLR